MISSDSSEVLAMLPQAVARVDRRGVVLWLAGDFEVKTGLQLEPGQPLLDVLERSPGKERLGRALLAGELCVVDLVTCALKQSRVRSRPSADGSAWVSFEPAGLDDEVAFAQALQEIARALGESLDVEGVCAAAVVAMVRCAEVARAEVYLVEESKELRRVASSSGEVEGAAAEPPRPQLTAASLRHALATGRPEIGISRGDPAGEGSIFAAVPLFAQRRTVGLLVLHKLRGESFSVRELDLWSAASGQLAVAVENARLLREAQAALRTRDEFMSIASHELKTPLTPLKMCLYSMERRLLSDQPVELSSIVKSKKQVDRLAGLVDDLLDASRLELGKLAITRAPIELAQLVLEVVDGFRMASDREFQLVMPGERLWVQGDHDRLEQVLVNLIENAHKYSPAGQPVVIELEPGPLDVFLTVVDRGIGIPGADQGQIFQRFYRARNANRNFGGLGLGLFISHSIVKLHGGGLALQSDEGRGSRFTVRLPRMSPAEVAALPRRVLLIDPGAAAQGPVTERLAGSAFELVVAKDEGQALRRLASATVDAVLLAAGLPRAELFLRTSLSLPRVRPVPVVLLGGPEQGGAPAGVVRCAWPCEKAKLIDALEEAIGVTHGGAGESAQRH